MNYHYPMNEIWTKQEVIDVVHFFTLIERSYEQSVKRKALLSAYQTFKQIVSSKSEEKTYFADFEKASGYSSYHAVKKARETDEDKIIMRRKAGYP